MRGFRTWLVLGVCVYLLASVEGRKKLKRDQSESLKSAESDDDVEYEDVSQCSSIMEECWSSVSQFFHQYFN